MVKPRAHGAIDSGRSSFSDVPLSMAVLGIAHPRTGPTEAISPSQGLDDRRGPSLSRFLRTISSATKLWLGVEGFPSVSSLIPLQGPWTILTDFSPLACVPAPGRITSLFLAFWMYQVYGCPECDPPQWDTCWPENLAGLARSGRSTSITAR